jgi:hypothetical protein
LFGNLDMNEMVTIEAVPGDTPTDAADKATNRVNA